MDDVFEKIEVTDSTFTMIIQILLVISGYAAISELALKKILIYLRKGFGYSHSVFLANIKKIIPSEFSDSEESMKNIETEICNIIDSFKENSAQIKAINTLIGKNKRNNFTYSEEASTSYQHEIYAELITQISDHKWDKLSKERQENLKEDTFKLFKIQMSAQNGIGSYISMQSLDSSIKNFLIDNFDVESQINKLYHPSLRPSPSVSKDKDNLQLRGVDLIPVNSPVFKRAVHKLEHVINELLKKNIIYWDTEIRLIINEDILSSNERKAISDHAKDEEKKKVVIVKELKKYLNSNKINTEISEKEILKYELWEEQKHMCPYTNSQIGLADIFGDVPKFDLNYIAPLSLTFDRSKANRVLADINFCNDIKKNQLYGQLEEKEVLYQKFDHINKEIWSLKLEIDKYNRISKVSTTPDQKANALVKKHKANIKRFYLIKKYSRLVKPEIKTTSKYAIQYDNSFISKFTKEYLSNTFNRVSTFKSEYIDLIKHYWGISKAIHPDNSCKYTYHICDTIITGCVYRGVLSELEEYLLDKENFLNPKSLKKPWATINKDLLNVLEKTIPIHDKELDLLKQSKKAVYINHKLLRNENNEVVYQKCHTVRGNLHKSTQYGAFKITDPDDLSEKIHYTLRKDILSLEEKDIDLIIDEDLKGLVRKAKEKEKIIHGKISKILGEAKTYKSKDDKEKREELYAEVNKLRQDIVHLYRYTSGGTTFTIKKVKLYARTVKNPLKLKEHTFKSKHPHKRHVYVSNDSNYSLAIYQDFDKEKKKYIKDFEIINNLEAVHRFKLLQKSNPDAADLKSQLFIEEKEAKNKLLKLTAQIKTGSIILFWENDPNEVWKLSPDQLKQRMYKVIGFSKQIIQKKYLYGSITLNPT